MAMSLKWKLSGVVVLALVAMCVAFGFDSTRAARDYAARDLALRAKGLASMAAASVAEEAALSSVLTSQILEAALEADPDVRSIALYSEERGLMDGRARKGVDLPVRLEHRQGRQMAGDHMSVVEPIADGRRGYFEVSMDARGIDRVVAERWTTLSVVALILVVVFLVLSYLTIGRMLSPLDQLARSAQQVAKGDIPDQIDILARGDEVGRVATSFEQMIARLRELCDHARRIASGDLTGRIEGDGELFESFRAMSDSLRELTSRLERSSSSVATAAATMFSAIREQESSATQQTASLEAIRGSLEALATAADGVTQDVGFVTEMANRSLESSQRIADHTRLVSQHSERIGEILTLIQEIADRSDLLAFNAALEGTKAGDVGRGFSLVAEEMRRLSEHVMDSVRDIRKLVSDMRSASHASVLATEEGIKLARDTAASSDKISQAIMRQREDTSLAKASADEVVRVVNQSLDASIGSSESAEALLQLSQELKETVSAFQASR